MSKRKSLGVDVLLVALTLAVYAQLHSYPFINLDDDRYVRDNPHVQTSLNLESLTWALTTDAVSNWHPLAWISHMLDYQMFGLNAGRYHLVNVLLHVANTLLLFLVLRRMTGAAARSAIVAALFAVHPLHVESVAWIAERKDVLSAFFWMAAMGAYAAYAKRPGVVRYLSVCVLFALGLMAKPMIVTLPCVLLLLDYWPLGRMKVEERTAKEGEPSIQSLFHPSSFILHPFVRLTVEKLPLFALSAASCVITLLVQQGAGSVISLDTIPVSARLGNAVVAYVRYIGKTLWPADLAVFYPHLRVAPPAWQIVGAIIVLALITVFAIRTRRTRPYLAVGWLWFVGTLVPVIGLLQVGFQAMADRYTYIPLIGLFVAVVWGVGDWVAARRVSRIAVVAPAAALVAALTVTAALQVRYWRDSVVLFEHALAVTENNGLAHYNLGVTLLHQGKPDAAIPHFIEAIRIHPADVSAHINLGSALFAQGKYAESVPHFEDALRLEPENAHAHYDLGTALSALGKDDEAVVHFAASLRGESDRPEALYNLGTTLYRLGKLEEAVLHLCEAIRLKPDYLEARINLGNALAKLGKNPEATAQYQEVLRVDPNRREACVNLGYALTEQGRLDEAAAAFSDALRLNPNDAVSRANLLKIRQEIARRQQIMMNR